MELRNRRIPSATTATSPARTRRRRTSTTEGATSEQVGGGVDVSPKKFNDMESSSLLTSEERVGTTNSSTCAPDAPVSLKSASIFRRGLAWFVHFYTGLGLLINAYSLHEAIYGASPNFTLFAQLNWLAIFVDATDGTMARRFDVKHLAAGLDGALLDNIIDFQTFSLLPALSVIVFEQDLFGTELAYIIAACILVSSGYAFCQTSAKTEEAFVGFPSYWNILLFYVHYLQPSKEVAAALFFGCSILSFIPIHFIYPTRTKAFFKVTMALA